MELISDGVGFAGEILAASSTVTCEPAYAFLPCTSNLWGLLFLIVVYQYLMSLGQKYVSAGSDLFFQITGPGIFGASLFHLLGTIPQIMLIIVSRLSGSFAAAQAQATVGMSLLAGQAVMNLTLIWGSCVALGSYDFSEASTSSESEHRITSSLTGTGVSTDDDTRFTSRIMIVSMIPFLILQLTKITDSSSGRQVTILIALIVTLALLFAHVLFQIFQPWIQSRRFEYLSLKFVKDKLLGLISYNGRPNVALIKEIFHEIDKNNDSHISTAELRVLILGIQLQQDGIINNDDYVEKFRESFDISGDDHIDENEFVKGLSKWLLDARQSVNQHNHRIPNFFGRKNKDNEEEKQSLLIERKKNQSGVNSWRNYIKAAYLLLLGTTISVLLALPLVQTVVDFAITANVPSFLIPYVVIPVALNYPLARRTIALSRQKTRNSISLTLSQIYGSVFMSNMIGLTTYLIVVYIRDLSWDVSAEVLVVLIICTAMGLFTSFNTKFPLWTSYLAILLYPLSLLLLFVLTTILGWS